MINSIKNKLLVLAIAIASLAALPLYAQDLEVKMSREEYKQLERREHDRVKDQKERDADNIADLRDDRRNTKEKAVEAKRVERDANDAARHSRNAYRAEKKAQKSRMNADKQAKKASKSRDRSNSND